MAEIAQDTRAQAELAALGIEWPPSEDELPYDDGIPMETPRHALQLQLLMDPLRLYWTGRQDICIGCNMFVYFSLHQGRTQDFRGRDFFVVLDVPKRGCVGPRCRARCCQPLKKSLPKPSARLPKPSARPMLWRPYSTAIASGLANCRNRPCLAGRKHLLLLDGRIDDLLRGVAYMAYAL